MRTDAKELVDDMRIKIPRTPEFYTVARRLSNFIKDLPLSHKQNDDLIALLLEQIKEGEHGGFTFGLKMGSDICQAHMRHRARDRKRIIH